MRRGVLVLHYFMMIRFLLPILIWLSAALPALAQAVEARSDHFVLISEAPVDAAALLSDLEQFRLAVMADLGLQPDADEPPLRLNIIRDLDVFAAISPGGITAAIYRQSAAGNDIVIGYSEDPEALLGNALDPGGLRLVLRHEFVHHILEMHYPRKLPIWLGEGLAEYYATFEQTQDGQSRFGRALPEQDLLSDTRTWLPMRTVIESMARYPDFRTIPAPSEFWAQRLYYGQSWALAHFIMDRPDGLARIHRFVDRWHPATDSEDSFEQEFGLRYDRLEAEVRQEFSGRANDLQGRPIPGLLQRLTSRTPTADDIALNHLRLILSHGRDSRQNAHLIERLRAQVGRADREPSLDQQFADALWHWKAGDWTAADMIITDILARDPAHPAALKLNVKSAYRAMAERQTDQARWIAAEDAAIQALASQPHDAELHLFRVAATAPINNRLPEAARASLDWLIKEQTHLRMPSLSMMMVPALIYEKRFDHAEHVLDFAERWTIRPTDQRVIDNLRANVDAQRAAQVSAAP